MTHIDFLPGGARVAEWERLDDCRVPHLVPQTGMVMADMIFRSPAIVLRRGRFAIALLPDLHKIKENRDAPWIMDFDRYGPAGTPRLTIGLMPYRVYKHVYFMSEPDKTITIPREGLSFSAHLLISGNADENFTRSIHHFLWQRYGVENYKMVRPQVLPLDEQAKEAMDRIFKRGDLYFEFENEGRKNAGIAAFAATTKKDLKPVWSFATGLYSKINSNFLGLTLTLGAKLGMSQKTDDALRYALHNFGLPFLPQAWFQSWFNNMRTAYAARILAEKWNDDALKEQTVKMKNLALSAPVEDGIFSAVCFFPEGRVQWKKGTRTFTPIDDYHTPDAATTGYFLLRWYRDVEQDPAILQMAGGLSRFLIKHQLPSGAVPTWINGRTHAPDPRLLQSASTAGPLMFMALLASITRDESALVSARRMARFIEREVLPTHRWFDYETFYSCSRRAHNFRDSRSGVLPQNAMSMCWAAEGMRLLYSVTGNAHYKELLLRVLDDLLFHQQVWNAPMISINTFGGFGSMNTDAEWNDARQGIIAPVLMDTYRATRNPDHFQRGVAALRSCYTTMLHPAFKEVAPGNMKYYRDGWRGSIYENYSHLGFDSAVPGYLMPDWGAGTAALATAHAGKFFGDIYIDMAHGRAFGINGCAVSGYRREGNTVGIEVSREVPGLDQLQIFIEGADSDTRLLVKNINMLEGSKDEKSSSCYFMFNVDEQPVGVFLGC